MLVIASPIRKDKINNGVTHICELHLANGALGHPPHFENLEFRECVRDV